MPRSVFGGVFQSFLRGLIGRSRSAGVVLLLFLVFVHQNFPQAILHWIGGQRPFSLSSFPDHLVARESLHKFSRLHAKWSVGPEFGVDCRVRNLCWVELLHDPFIDAQGQHFFNVSWTRAERKAL